MDTRRSTHSTSAAAIWQRGAVAAVAAAALALAGASSAHATRAPALAVQPDGTAHLAWVTDQQKAATRAWPAAGSLLTGEALSTPSAEAPEVAANAAGQVVFVWHRHTLGGDPYRIEARRRNADGTFGPVAVLTTPGHPGRRGQVAISETGSAFVVWERGSYIVGRRIAADGTVGPTRFLSSADHGKTDPDVAMDGAGNAFVVWRRQDWDTNEETVQVRRVSANDTLGVAKTLGLGSAAVLEPQVGVDAAGNAVIAWLEWDGVRRVPMTRVRHAIGTFSGIQPMFAGGSSAEDMQLAVNPAGDATVVWSRNHDVNQTIELRRRAADGTLGLLRTMSAQDDTIAEEPRVAMDPDGGAYVAWEQHPGPELKGNHVIHGRRRTPAGTLTAIQQLSDAADYAGDTRVGVDGDGNATIVWEARVPGQPTLTTIEARRRLTGAGVLTPVETTTE